MNPMLQYCPNYFLLLLLPLHSLGKVGNVLTLSLDSPDTVSGHSNDTKGDVSYSPVWSEHTKDCFALVGLQRG
jgi:hypothetical protein